MVTGNGTRAVSIAIREVNVKHVVVDAPVDYETFIRSLERILGQGPMNRIAKPRKARQYLIGDSLTAVRMTRWNLGAALYDPLRVVVHQRTDGDTRIEYDLPSSLLDQFGSAEVIEVAVSLDMKLETLISRAAAGS
jgi:hypothetical protein